MPLTINTNSAAAAASYNLSKNQASLQKSLTRLSSGSRIVQPVDDAGGLAVSMKMESAIVRLSGAQKNVQNATSFLEAAMPEPPSKAIPARKVASAPHAPLCHRSLQLQWPPQPSSLRPACDV